MLSLSLFVQWALGDELMLTLGATFAVLLVALPLLRIISWINERNT